MSDINTDTSKQEAERLTDVSGGPVPTASEERAAEQAAGDVDLDKVEENYRDMTKKGAEVEGEGDISGGHRARATDAATAFRRGRTSVRRCGAGGAAARRTGCRSHCRGC